MEQDTSYLSIAIRNLGLDQLCKDQVIEIASHGSSWLSKFAGLTSYREYLTGEINPVTAGEMLDDLGMEIVAVVTPLGIELKVLSGDERVPERNLDRRDGDLIDMEPLYKIDNHRLRNRVANLRFNRHHRKRQRRYWMEKLATM